MSETAPIRDVMTLDQPKAPAAVAPLNQSESAAIFSMIERAARDPSVDIDKMQRLMEMREGVAAREAERAFNVAMKAAQAEMRPIGANAHNPQTKSRYATYDKLDRALRPIYTKHGFSLSFDEADSPKPEHIRVVCYVAHDEGHTRVYRKDMPADGKGAKGGDVMTKTHATGAAASYGARYLLKGIFNVAIGEEDRDGNEPVAVAVITDEQAMDLRDLVEASGANLGKFLGIFKVDALGAIPAKRHAEAVRILQDRQASQGGRR